MDLDRNDIFEKLGQLYVLERDSFVQPDYAKTLRKRDNAVNLTRNEVNHKLPVFWIVVAVWQQRDQVRDGGKGRPDLVGESGIDSSHTGQLCLSLALTLKSEVLVVEIRHLQCDGGQFC